MGLSSADTATEAIQLCIFDLRRGQQEGQELDKILFFFPADFPFSRQLSVIGLSEGLITFTRIFSPEVACEVIEADRHTHVFYEAEPDIWMVMIVEKNESEAIWRVDALQKVLKEIHSLFLMFHGSIRALLEKEPAGGLIRSHLYPFIIDYLRACQKRSPLDNCCCDFLFGKKLLLPSFRDCLKERGTVQMLTVSREAAIEVQVDTISLFTYAVLRLTPHALSSGVSSWSYLRKGNTASHVATGSTLTHSASVLEQIYGSWDTSHGGDDSYHVARPLQQDRWSKGNDGFLVTDLWGAENGSSTPAAPTIWLQQTQEKMYLSAYQYRSLTLILLVPVASLNGEQGVSLVKQQVHENASLKMLKVEEILSKGWGGENAYHVSGYRYLLVDGDRSVSRSSPPGKVTTLTKESLLVLSKVREEVDLEKGQMVGDNAGLEKDLEICIRAKNNAWVIARITKGKEVYMVLERANETLLYASEAVEKFSNRYCNGAFSLD
ncbi:vacuolar fusion protein CCZ1 homolog A-like isoform X3 [Juglans microcarpa x Juglans regia]|uniref:vacuolar fusion protein CCZ1 homolog A-like isoform X3 n=1 Tax=Juglans microcarpa x Juglans regia TaxID=2249226 RepID=UPI001B7E515D|nr:vacuolar fusion protein CCZ1 homolog A-like isoform X3 [Juglans microcarpa x Juglans regia]